MTPEEEKAGPRDELLGIINFQNGEAYTKTRISDRTISDLISKVAGFVTLIFYVIRFLVEEFQLFATYDVLLQHDDSDVNVDKSTVSRGFQRLKMYLM